VLYYIADSIVSVLSMLTSVQVDVVLPRMFLFCFGFILFDEEIFLP